MRRISRSLLTASFVGVIGTGLSAQAVQPPVGQAPPSAVQPDLPPATKLEGFKPEAGSVVTVGYDDLGAISYGMVAVSVRDARDTKGHGVRGLRVAVVASEYRGAVSFVDADEISELIKGLDALLAVKANPTQFEMFEVRYTTRGDLELTAFSDSKGRIKYCVEAGRTLTASREVDAAEMRKLRGMFETALQKLAATEGK